MKLEQSFEVAAPVERVWATLIDLEQVAPCLPGAAITGHDDEGTYHGTFQVKLGPTTASYRGTIRIEEADDERRKATLAARGTDKRGQGGASATIVNTLHATEGGGTRVEAVTDFTITGRLASFGRGGMIKDISNRLLRDFASCLQQRLAEEPAGAGAAPSSGVGTGDEEALRAAAGQATGATTGAPEATAAEGGAAEPSAPATPSSGVETGDQEALRAAAGQATGAAPGTTTGAGRTAGATTGVPGGGAASAQPQQAAPVEGFSLLLGVLGDRAKALGATIAERVKTRGPVVVERVKAQAPVVLERVKTRIAQARARRSG